MKISVIIPTFNEEKNIINCILSLHSQTQKDIEIIIIDDGSTDNTLDLIKNLKVNVHKQNHQGPALARNLGARHAKGEILVFVDADMEFDKNFVRNLVKPIVEKKAKGTFSKEEYVKNWNNIWAKCWNINENLPSKKRLPSNYPDHQKVFRAILKSEFEKVDGFSKGGYTDDYTLSEKLGYQASSAKDAIFYHNNPDNLDDVFKQAKWVGKREYKLGPLGILLALIRSSFLFSIILGLYKSIKVNNFSFVIFKIVYDLGIFIGILEMVLTGKTSK